VSEFAEYIDPDSYNLKIIQVKKDLLELKFQYRLLQEASEVRRRIKRNTVRAVFSYITSHQLPPATSP